MSNPNQDFQTDLLQDLQSIVQQEYSLELQNNHQPNSMSEPENSLTSGRNSFQSENQNINFSDHTPALKQNQLRPELPHLKRESNRLFDYSRHNTDLHLPQKIDDQGFGKSQKLQPEQSQNKSAFQEEQNFSMTQEFQESFNETSMSAVGRRGYKRKILPQNIKLSHRDHLLLGGKVISGLEKNIVSLPFREPVDVQKYNIPDYLEIIKQPMDLRTIKRKIYNEEYDTVDQVYADIELIIQNSMKYNELNSDFVRLTKNFEKSYHKIRRDCERNMRKLKIEEEKKSEAFTGSQKSTKKMPKYVENNFPSNDVEVMSNFEFKELTKLAKKIKKLQAQEQIQLFRKIGIVETMVIDIKTLNTKQVKSLMKQVQRIEKSKEQFIRNEQKKENSHLTTCDNEYRYTA